MIESTLIAVLVVLFSNSVCKCTIFWSYAFSANYQQQPIPEKNVLLNCTCEKVWKEAAWSLIISDLQSITEKRLLYSSIVQTSYLLNFVSLETFGALDLLDFLKPIFPLEGLVFIWHVMSGLTKMFCGKIHDLTWPASYSSATYLPFFR